jgi:hypothetical protein
MGKYNPESPQFGSRAASSSRIMPHRISVSLPASHVVLEGFRDFKHALDVVHAEHRFLRQRDGLARLDRILNLHTPVSISF